jgi:glycosyltransferase involved in cell wall biosynthesis
MKPKLCICILTYNRAIELRKELDSILCQINDSMPIEIVISDDASSDNTKDVVDGYINKYKSIRYRRNDKNVGLDQNLISAISNIDCSYISLFSDDDIVLPGTINCILELIEQYNPSIICSSHYGFEDDNYLIKHRVYFPKKNIVFNNGLEFFLYAGLGFLPSLTLKTEYAKEFIKSVRIGKWSAHLDVATRIALSKKGPFIFLGTHPVAGRIPQTLTYDLMINGFINVIQLYHELEHEGLLCKKNVADSEKAFIRNDLPKYILNQLVMGDYKRMYKQKELVKKTFGRHWQFYLFVYPLFFMPRHLLKIPYIPLRQLIRHTRIYKYNRKNNLK